MQVRFAQMLFCLVIPMLLVGNPVMAQDDAEDKKEEVATGPEQMVFRFKDKKFLSGMPLNWSSVDIYVMGTKVKVPLDSILGIRMGEGPDQPGHIALKDGETLKGILDVGAIRVGTDWGEASLNVDKIYSVVRSRNLRWQLTNTPSGPRWFLSGQNIQMNSSSGIYVPADGSLSNVSYEFDAATSPAPAAASASVQPVQVAPAVLMVPVSNRGTNTLVHPAVNSREFNYIW